MGRGLQPGETREVYACHDGESLVVYQAYCPAIAKGALRAQRFVPPFGRGRMTWIKPSFNWMMYRCGYGSKTNQEEVLAIRIQRAGFEWALQHACLSSFDPAIHPSEGEWRTQLAHSPVRVQWDPERTIDLQRLDRRAIQVGIGPDAVGRYVDEWIVGIEQVTELAHQVSKHVQSGANQQAAELVRQAGYVETLLPLSGEYAHLGMGALSPATGG